MAKIFIVIIFHACSNNDKYVETYPIEYYLKYMNNWSEMCLMAETSSGIPIGYSKSIFFFLIFNLNFFLLIFKSFLLVLVMGKSEGKNNGWHGHVTAIAIAPKYRRLGAAKALMDKFEQASEMYIFIPFHISFVSFISISNC